MHLTHEHELLRKTYLQIIEQDINPHVDAWEDAGIFPAHEVFRKLGDAGLLGVNKPTDYGGLGLDFSYSAVVAETAWRINCGGVPMAIGVQTDMATPALARFGSPELCAEYLTPAIAGDAVACIGVSEPQAGSDVAAIRSRARRDGDDYVIDGTKMWITNGTQADWMCMLVNTGDGPAHSNKSLIIVPLREGAKRTPGVTVARSLKKLGMRSSDTAEIHFDGVRVPVRNRIGEEGRGFTYQMLQFQEERMFAALGAITTCDRTLAETIDYTRQRRAFGRAILDNQAIQFRLSELLTELEALRAMTWRAVEAHVAGEDCTLLASMAKLKGTRLQREVNDACLQYWGGMGYMDETPVSRRYRDDRLTSIGGGADEIMLGIIAKRAGLVGSTT